MKEILLHIGMNKTGSTAIQAALKGYRDEETEVASFDIPNHSIPMSTLFRDSPETYAMHVQRGRTPDEVRVLQAEYRAILDRQIAGSSFNRLVISGEGMSTLSDPEKRRMLTFFEEKCCRVKVLCLVRDPVGFTTSVVQQHIKIGKERFDPITPEYQFRLDLFRQALPAQDLIVHSYEDLIAEHGDAVTGFGNLVGLDTTRLRSKRLNVSLSATATKLLFRLNRAPTETLGTPQRFRARTQLITLLSKWFPSGPTDRLDPQVVAGLLAPNCVADIAYLAQSFGIDYPIPDKKTDVSRVESYLAQPTQLDMDYFDQNLRAQGVHLPLGCSLDEKLVALYDHLIASDDGGSV